MTTYINFLIYIETALTLTDVDMHSDFFSISCRYQYGLFKFLNNKVPEYPIEMFRYL